MVYRLLTEKIHKFIDIALVLLFFLAPLIFDFGANEIAKKASLGCGALLIALRYMPFGRHGLVELILGFLLMGIPGLLGLESRSQGQIFFVLMGVAMEISVGLTNYDGGRPPGSSRLKNSLKS